MTALALLKNPNDAIFLVAPVSEHSELATEDPLAMDYITQQLGLLLLPALTTRSTRAQAFAMVLYGLDLVEKAIRQYGYPATDERRRFLFERWERFWALASFEMRDGQLPRGDSDAMRGVRGAQKYWKSGSGPLPIDFTLIQRQQELGNLGAYLAPLRRSRLVNDGLRPSNSASDIIEAFWDEPAANKHVSRYTDYALLALDTKRSTFPRRHAGLTLYTVGERSRLSSLVARRRKDQQDRLFKVLVEDDSDPTTKVISHIVHSATQRGLTATRKTLVDAAAGAFGEVSDEIRGLLVTAVGLGDVAQALVGVFDTVYDEIARAGGIASRSTIEHATAGMCPYVSRVCTAFLSTPRADAIRQLPVHGSAFTALVDHLKNANATSLLSFLLEYHSSVQKDRSRGKGWIHEEAGKLRLRVTSYSARPNSLRFPTFKLDVVRSLLVDTGRLPQPAPKTAASAA